MAEKNDPVPANSAVTPTAGPPAAGIQTTPSAGAAELPERSIKLPPRMRSPLAMEEQALAIARLNLTLVLITLLLAFLVTSFTVRNSDFWMHLAAGRDLLAGKYWFGQDPYSYSNVGTYWANHAWLYDVGLYGLYETLGGPAVVVFKALLIAALAAVMLRIRRPDQDFWLPAACTVLAVLALGTRLFLQPTIVSYLLLGLTLWLLQRSYRAKAADEGKRFDFLWLLPPLFVVWVNLDGWFLVGLAAVGLFVLGEVLQRYAPLFAAAEPAPPPEGRLGRLALVLLVSVAACLVSPHTYHVFTLPPELTIGDSVPLLRQERDFRSYFFSPFEPSYWQARTLWASVSGLAFFPLAVLSLASFVLNLAGWRWWRMLVWLGFFALAANRWHLIPFFAIVAGPIAVLNFQDVLARRPRPQVAGGGVPSGGREWVAAVQVVSILGLLLLGVKLLTRLNFYTEKLAGPELPIVFLVFAGVVLALFCFAMGPLLQQFDRVFLSWSLGGRLLTVLGGLTFLVLAWPGWLHTGAQDPYTARRVAWDVEVDPSLHRLALRLDQLRREGNIAADDHGFATLPQVSGYCAWFCRDEKNFFDHRFPLFAPETRTFLKIRDLLTRQEGEVDGRSTNATALASDFEKYHITHVIISGGTPVATLERIAPLAGDPEHWSLLYVDGRNAIFGWRPPGSERARDPWEEVRYDLGRFAYANVAAEDRAPAEPAREPVIVPPWAQYMAGPAPRPLETDKALLDLLLFETNTESWGNRNLIVWQAGFAGGWWGTANPTLGPLSAAMLFAHRGYIGRYFYPQAKTPQRNPGIERLAATLFSDFMMRQDEAPAAFPLLAVRAGRRAVAENPQDAFAYLRLEQAYHTLRARTRERFWCDQLPSLGFLRHVQRVAALEHAATVEPTLPEVHDTLATLYEQFSSYSMSDQHGPVGFLDQALKHRREQLRLIKAIGRGTQQGNEDFKDRLKKLEKEVSDLQARVQEKQNQFEVRAATPALAHVYDKAREACRLGLPERALAVLLESDALEFGQAGARLQLELLLTMGRVAEAERLLNDPGSNLKGNLGRATFGLFVRAPYDLPAFEWYQFLVAAARGDYAEADQQMDDLLKQLEPDMRILGMMVVSELMETPQEKPLAYLARKRLENGQTMMEAVQALMPSLHEKADTTVLRGLLALEAGNTARAEQLFRQAVAIGYPPNRYLPFLTLLAANSPLEAAVLVGPAYQHGSGPVFDFRGREMAVQYLQLMEEAK